MAQIPVELMYLEVAMCDGVAHRPYVVQVEQPDARTGQALKIPVIYPKCATTGEPVRGLQSAAFAHLMGAQACEDERCFGPELAAGPPVWRRVGPSVGAS